MTAGALHQILLTSKIPIGTPVSLGGATGVAAASSVALTTIAAIPAGATVFVAVQVGKATTISVSTVSDGTNSYTLAKSAGYGSTSQSVVELWYIANAAAVASGATLTATFSAASIGGTNVPIIVAAYATGLLATPLDKTNSTNYEPGTAYASGSTGVLTRGNQLAIGALGFYIASAVITEGSGFTQIVDQDQGSGNRWRAHLAYQVTATTTALNYQPSISTSVYGGSIIATFMGN